MARPGEIDNTASTSIQKTCSAAIDFIKERNNQLIAIVVAFDGRLASVGTRPELASNLVSAEDVAEILEVIARDLRAAIKRSTS